MTVKERLSALVEPKNGISEGRRAFSNADIKRLVVPLFFEQLLLMTVGVADTFMISYAGQSAVSGVSLVNMFVAVFMYLFTALASGGAVVVSQYIGSGDKDSAELSAGQLLTCSVCVSVVLALVSIVFNRSLMSLMFGSVDSDVMDACVVYLRISAYSFPALAVYNAGAAICRSMNKTNVTMYISIIANVINIIGNAIGVFVLKAGVAGVAYPSLIARAFSAAAVTWYCRMPSGYISYRLKHILAWNRDMVRRILRIAVPNGVENGLFQLIKVALSSIVALFGTAQIAANGVAQSIWSLAALTVLAMGPAFITVVGQCMGAGDLEAADYYLRKLLRITYLMSVAWNLLILALTPILMQVYALDPEVKRLVVMLVVMHNVFNALFFPVSGALSNGLRAAGDVRYAMLVSVLSTVLCRLVLSVVFGIWLDMGVIGIAIAMCCDWAVRALFIALRYKSGKWKRFKVI